MILDEATSAFRYRKREICASSSENMMQTDINRNSCTAYLQFKSWCDYSDGYNCRKEHEELIALRGTYNKLVTMQSLE
jgi:ABC-type multidrug transport system fused ATPase/permease subunit